MLWDGSNGCITIIYSLHGRNWLEHWSYALALLPLKIINKPFSSSNKQVLFRITNVRLNVCVIVLLACYTWLFYFWSTSWDSTWTGHFTPDFNHPSNSLSQVSWDQTSSLLTFVFSHSATVFPRNNTHTPQPSQNPPTPTPTPNPNPPLLPTPPAQLALPTPPTISPFPIKKLSLAEQMHVGPKDYVSIVMKGFFGAIVVNPSSFSSYWLMRTTLKYPLLICITWTS